ncbi:UDP-N-acetylmuramate dehydrogenase [Cellulomonas sp. zg-ZUI222]|uniref:UDP-N-acetylenolpyruvoylglucosamine reductase n=1 Tax=Cellulomonas wangleii TaxID=2816956 RepID=A0ABX8D4V3_9CELL|nr:MULTISPECIES: UDP-N-acetylmuramate dehydrogenase [Cellulomonas]MBO0899606.1 UDP-N-acetylmuramate dehydrogenase [Cellulomonas sp. zg-ZUI22]MBO0920468.1 UDP-N-acetylmuramate dehydrogenase [Cellulomonas wangleii]MBO0923114.1 UDP-N-acetylmuramate dehydrogenase [Cellulomonas wangleii]QVI61496.1 UDP-N-acetylmuramate dehydrogenase [Cellulomonas wangleii]
MELDTCALPGPPPEPAHPAVPTHPGTPALADLTTLHVGGPATRYVETTTEAELVETVRAADAAGEPLLVLGGGSNVLVGDAGFPGVVVRDVRGGIEVPDASACGGVTVTVPAGTVWDDVVAYAVQHGLVGVEALSGIPGSTGATPVQNVGAYGQEVAQTVAQVRVWDRGRGRVRTLPFVTLGFGYRTSVLKRSMRPDPADPAAPWGPTPRYVVLDVTFQMKEGSLSAPVGYPELARALDITVGERAPLADVRAAVLALRARKGMVLDASDRDTWSAGSFFTNPVVADAGSLPADAPRWPMPDGAVKTSAAWLIEHAGFSRGYGAPGPATLSTKHTLALTNRGEARADDLLALARTVRDGVRDRFGVVLEPEPVLVGVTL